MLAPFLSKLLKSCTLLLIHGLLLIACGSNTPTDGNEGPTVVTDTAFKQRCDDCHNLDGSPNVPFGPANITLGPNNCQITACNNTQTLATWIAANMPPGAGANTCVDACAQETALLITSNFQVTPTLAQRIESILNTSKVTAYDNDSGETVDLKAAQ